MRKTRSSRWNGASTIKAQGEPQSEKASRELAALLEKEGYQIVTNEVADGAGWGSWRARTDRILENFVSLTD